MNKIVKNIINYPTPSNLSIWWNFGSLLLLFLGVQIVTGLLISCHYTPSVIEAFDSVILIKKNVTGGWLIQSIHANGASCFFLCIYIHIGRGIYYGSFIKRKIWFSGVVLYLLRMAIAFLGYVLPWGQIRFWGACVITNIITAIPVVGTSLSFIIWGGFTVDDPTLHRFFVLHFILPFVLACLIVIHIYFLHEVGSSNPLGIKRFRNIVPFHPFYSVKDFLGFILILLLLGVLCLFYPQLLVEPLNYIPANPIITPPHIQPEWYFLWAYTILRSIPNKTGGVFVIVSAIFILFFLPFIFKKFNTIGLQFSLVGQILFWMFIGDLLLITYIGINPVEPPFIILGQLSTIFYFLFFGLLFLVKRLEEYYLE